MLVSKARSISVCAITAAIVAVAPQAASAFDAEAVTDPIYPVLTAKIQNREARARVRAVDSFHAGEKRKSGFRWSGRKVSLLRYNQPLQLGEREMKLKVRVPGKRGTWMRVELEF